MKFRIDFIDNIDVSEEKISQIIQLKEQHWKHGFDSQYSWIKTNINDGDIHVMLYTNSGGKDFLNAYLNLVCVNVKFDYTESEQLGLGNVCVDKSNEHSGYGKLIVNAANVFVKAFNKEGILLCKPQLIKFYENCGWNVVLSDKSFICDNVFNGIIMTSSKNKYKYKEIHISRNF